jgi:hypothetical protein
VITEEEKKRQREIRRKLDEVVGSDFDAPLSRGFTEWLRTRWLKWLLGALFGVLAMLLVFYTIESHRVPPAQPAPTKKPIPVQIIPAR